jgi:thymidylate synthase (FAD)
MGTDLTVVNAARVSFDKQSEYEYDPSNDLYVLSHQDQKLINYLAKHGHWTPFAHPQITVHIKAPIFVARQLGKHQVGMVWNEVSRRYVDSEPEFYSPKSWRARAENVKQGSSEETIFSSRSDRNLTDLHNAARAIYLAMISKGICPEQARMVLPQSMYTEWYWTGSLSAFARVCKLRLDTHTQKETRDVTQQIHDIIKPLFPISWKALMENVDE